MQRLIYIFSALGRVLRHNTPASVEPASTPAEWRHVTSDPACWIYAALTIIAVMASSPSTWQIAAQFHLATPAGLTQTGAWVVLFEIGAVASLASVLLVPQWHRRLSIMHASQLLVVAIANYRAGAAARPDAFWLDLIIFAGAVPVVTFVFSWLFVARAGDVLRRPIGGIEVLLRQAQDRALRTILERQISAIDALMVAAPLALPEQATYPRPAAVRTQPVLTLPEACPACGAAASPMQLRTAAQHSGYRCKGCGKKVLAE